MYHIIFICYSYLQKTYVPDNPDDVCLRSNKHNNGHQSKERQELGIHFHY